MKRMCMSCETLPQTEHLDTSLRLLKHINFERSTDEIFRMIFIKYIVKGKRSLLKVGVSILTFIHTHSYS